MNLYDFLVNMHGYFDESNVELHTMDLCDLLANMHGYFDESNIELILWTCMTS